MTTTAMDIRMRLGPLARDLAQRKAGDERITQTHLEDAIAELIASKGSSGRDEGLQAQLQMLNENLIRLRHILLAASVTEEDEIAHCIEMLNRDLDQRQLKAAQKTGLDVPSLATLQEKLAARRQEFLAQEPAQPEMDDDLER